MRNVKIFDTTLRDGEQTPWVALSAEEKLKIARQLAKMKVDIIEAGFPVSSKEDFESVKNIAETISGPVICALARTKKEDIDAAAKSVSDAEKPRIHTFIATSKIHMDKKLKKSEDEILKIAGDMVEYAKTYVDDVEFSPEDASRTGHEILYKIVETAIDAGATTINIPDTVGYIIPFEFANIIKKLYENIPNIKKAVISVHCHDDLGLAVANSLAAVKEGAGQVECTINGLGERAGNAALEEIVMALKIREELFNACTNIDTKQIYPTSQLVSNLTCIEKQPNKAIVGRNAFAHEAGIHQDGIIKERTTYEIMDPRDIGREQTELVIGKHSGRHAIKQFLDSYGYKYDEKQLDEITNNIKSHAEKYRRLTKAEVRILVESILSEIKEKRLELDTITVFTGNKVKPTANVSLLFDGKLVTGTGTGAGPVDAASIAIMNAIGEKDIHLNEYHLDAITGSTDALARVSMTVSDSRGKEYTTRGVDPDIVIASVKALVKGMDFCTRKTRRG